MCSRCGASTGYSRLERVAIPDTILATANEVIERGLALPVLARTGPVGPSGDVRSWG